MESEKQTGYSRCRSTTGEGGSFFMRVYTFFSYAVKFVVPERKYGGEFSGEKVAVPE